MWHTIEALISEHTNTDFRIREKESVSGGDINLAFRIADEATSYFVKIYSKQSFDNFQQEFYSLDQLNRFSLINSPKPLLLGKSIDKSFLVIEHLNLKLPNDEDWYQLGVELAQTHQDVVHGEYGWQEDNVIGHTLQRNTWSKNWSMFFAEQRIGWQLQLLAEKGIYFGDIDHICQTCHDMLVSHHPRPSLLHGDLWQGNVGFTNEGPVIFDPACYYGDREADIAMTELFGQFPNSFYQGYQATFPLQKHYEQRKNLYNFYHVLNHANLFGGIYINQAKANLKYVLSS